MRGKTGHRSLSFAEFVTRQDHPLTPASNHESTSRLRPDALIWWILWFGVLTGLVVISVVLQSPAVFASNPALTYLPILPFAIATFIRWVLLPPVAGKPKGLPIFLIGMAIAETTALLGIFMAPEMRLTYIVLGVIGVFQFAPYFAGRSDR